MGEPQTTCTGRHRAEMFNIPVLLYVINCDKLMILFKRNTTRFSVLTNTNTHKISDVRPLELTSRFVFRAHLYLPKSKVS